MAPKGRSGVSGAVNAASIERAVRQAGLGELSPRALEQFDAYLELLRKWNSKLNLTAIREAEAIIRRHFVECIQCAQVLPGLAAGSTLLDFGSGAGFPGIPIAICKPELRVTLAESQGKKASFLREAARSLGLEAEVYDGRVEEMPAEKRFELVTLRAVDRMTEACQTALARLDRGGYIVLFATDLMEYRLKSNLPELTWKDSIQAANLDRGRILIGYGRMSK
jgi:16S rRNA (guanine527-N7)-methyltransferase